MREKRDHIVGSRNIFADLGFPDAEEMLAKAELAQKITAIIARRRLTQSQAAQVLGVDQPKISALKRGRLSGFSLERLLRFLMVLGRDIEIVVKQRRAARRGPARLLVS